MEGFVGKKRKHGTNLERLFSLPVQIGNPTKETHSERTIAWSKVTEPLVHSVDSTALPMIFRYKVAQSKMTKSRLLFEDNSATNAGIVPWLQ